MEGKRNPGTGTTFTIAERRSSSVTRSGRAYNCPSAEPTDDTPEPTTQKRTPGPTPGSADTPARTCHLLLGDQDTDSDKDHNLTAEELIQGETRQLDERVALRAAAQHTSETERPPECPTTSRCQAPCILGVFGSQTPPRVLFKEHRE